LYAATFLDPFASPSALGETIFEVRSPMLRLKLIIVCIFLSGAAVGCPGSRPARYSITDSKAYEASLFRQNCAICHGPEGEGKTLDDGKQVPTLRDGEFKFKTDAEIYKHIADGGNGMTPFRDQLTGRELKMMVDFVQKDLRGHNR
jgi:mono/diheme cytochrome c family protein